MFRAGSPYIITLKENSNNKNFDSLKFPSTENKLLCCFYMTDEKVYFFVIKEGGKLPMTLSARNTVSIPREEANTMLKNDELKKYIHTIL